MISSPVSWEVRVCTPGMSRNLPASQVPLHMPRTCRNQALARVASAQVDEGSRALGKQVLRNNTILNYMCFAVDYATAKLCIILPSF